jgi:hypothetical protein
MPCIIFILYESESSPNDYSCHKCHMSMNLNSYAHHVWMTTWQNDIASEVHRGKEVFHSMYPGISFASRTCQWSSIGIGTIHATRWLLKDSKFTCNSFLLSSFLTISGRRDLHSCSATLRRDDLSAISGHLSVFYSDLSAFSTTHYTPFLSHDNGWKTTQCGGLIAVRSNKHYMLYYTRERKAYLPRCRHNITR